MQRTTKTFIGGLVIGLVLGGMIGAAIQGTITLNQLEGIVWLENGIAEDDIRVSEGIDIRR